MNNRNLKLILLKLSKAVNQNKPVIVNLTNASNIWLLVTTRLPRWKNSKSEKKFENQNMIRRFPHQNQKKKLKAYLNAASKQTCFVQYIIYALISFSLLASDKQKNNNNLWRQKKDIYIETKYRMLQFSYTRCFFRSYFSFCSNLSKKNWLLKNEIVKITALIFKICSNLHFCSHKLYIHFVSIIGSWMFHLAKNGFDESIWSRDRK